MVDPTPTSSAISNVASTNSDKQSIIPISNSHPVGPTEEVPWFLEDTRPSNIPAVTQSVDTASTVTSSADPAPTPVEVNISACATPKVCTIFKIG
jgi:hypothetical protein